MNGIKSVKSIKNNNPVRIAVECDLKYDTVIVDFLNSYMRFLRGDYNSFNEDTFHLFINTVVKRFKDKKIFFVKKLIWELPEEFLRKALVNHRNSKIFFLVVSNKSEEFKCKERDDFVCYSLLNTISDSILISNDLKVLSRKNIENGNVHIDILSLYPLPVNIHNAIINNFSYSIPGDYSRVVKFGFTRSRIN